MRLNIIKIAAYTFIFSLFIFFTAIPSTFAQQCIWNISFGCSGEIGSQGYTQNTTNTNLCSGTKPNAASSCCCKSSQTTSGYQWTNGVNCGILGYDWEQYYGDLIAACGTKPANATFCCINKPVNINVATPPPATNLDTVNRCWTRKQCEEEYHGIWGKGNIFTSNKVWSPVGKIDSWSEKFCQPLNDGTPMARCFASNPNIPLQIGIPGIKTKYCSVYKLGEEPINCEQGGDAACAAANKGTCQPGIQGGFPGYLAAFYKFFIAALSVIAIVMVMWGGFKRIMAAGSPEAIKSANETIIGAITGVVIALLSYSLLNLVNTQLVANSMPLIEKVKPQTFAYAPKYHEHPEWYDSGYHRDTGLCKNSTDFWKGVACQEDGDCPPNTGKCVDKDINLKGKPDYNTCGHKLDFGGKENQPGIECLNDGEVCFDVPDTEGKRKKCGKYFAKGKITLDALDNIDMWFICNNGEYIDCNVKRPVSHSSDSEERLEANDIEYYAIGPVCYDGSNELTPLAACNGKGNFMGAALIIEVDYDGSGDPDYVLDAATCNGTAKFIRDASGDTNPSSGAFTWTDLNVRPMLFSSTNGTICDLNISKAEFPDR